MHMPAHVCTCILVRISCVNVATCSEANEHSLQSLKHASFFISHVLRGVAYRLCVGVGHRGMCSDPEGQCIQGPIGWAIAGVMVQDCGNRERTGTSAYRGQPCGGSRGVQQGQLLLLLGTARGALLRHWLRTRQKSDACSAVLARTQHAQQQPCCARRGVACAFMSTVCAGGKQTGGQGEAMGSQRTHAGIGSMLATRGHAGAGGGAQTVRGACRQVSCVPPPLQVPTHLHKPTSIMLPCACPRHVTCLLTSGMYSSSSASFLRAFRAMVWNASSTFKSSCAQQHRQRKEAERVSGEERMSRGSKGSKGR